MNNHFDRNFTLVVIGIVACIFMVAYYTSCREATVFNRLNKADFSCSDFFWASNQINTQSQTINLKTNEK